MLLNERPDILVNATAAEEGGALSILRQFLEAAIAHSHAFNIYVFTSIPAEEFRNKGVNIITVKKGGGFTRLRWDYFGFKKWVKENGIQPSLIISFQNTGLRFDPRVPQLIYYHQSAPFCAANWSMFNNEERVFWFYKNIYPYFTRVLVTPATYFVAQAGWIEKGIMKKFKVPAERVKVIRPRFQLNTADPAELSQPDGPEVLKLFYPAMPFINKNHIEIVEALHQLVNIEKLVDRNKVRVIFTCDFDKNMSFVKRIMQLGLEDCFRFTGKLAYRDVLAYYAAADVMIFPSVLESFALPLVEASALGLKILAADLEHAREVLRGYDGVQYVKVNSPKAWAHAIAKCFQHRERFAPFTLQEQGSWEDFFEFADRIITVKQGNPV